MDLKQENYGTRTFARFLIKKNTCKPSSNKCNSHISQTFFSKILNLTTSNVCAIILITLPRFKKTKVTIVCLQTIDLQIKFRYTFIFLRKENHAFNSVQNECTAFFFNFNFELEIARTKLVRNVLVTFP